MMKLGIVQGRLIQSPPGELQWFPQDDWEKEFFIASAIGLENIELIAERNHNSKNPIWSDKGVCKLLELSKMNNVKIHTLCNDHIVDYSLVKNPSVLKQNLEQFLGVIIFAQFNHFTFVKCCQYFVSWYTKIWPNAVPI